MSDSMMISESKITSVMEMMLDMQDEATKFHVIKKLYAYEKGNGLFLTEEMCKALFGEGCKKVNIDETQAE